MTDVEVVIKIPEEIYEDIKEHGLFGYCRETVGGAIANGTVFEKGHGRIGDLDKLIQAMKERNDDNGGESLNMVDRGYDLAYQHMVEEVEECVIMKADKEN